MHILDEQFQTLYNKQPKELSDIEKYLRIDKLSCIDMSQHLAVSEDVSHARWFVTLSVIINEKYKEFNPSIVELEAFANCCEIQLYSYGKLLSNSLAKEVIKRYISYRYKLIIYITQSLCPTVVEKEAQLSESS